MIRLLISNVSIVILLPEKEKKNIKEVADYYKDKISQRLYNGMYRYEVEIDD